jgi:hypothetical protein
VSHPRPGVLGSLLIALVALAAIPEIAHACPACFDGPGETRRAFLATTAFLTLLPLGLVAGAGAWLRSRADRADKQASGNDSPQG